MSFGTPNGPDGLWWTVPYDGEPAIKMFLPLTANPDEPVVLAWQGTTDPGMVLEFFNKVNDILNIRSIESLADDPPRRLTSRELNEFLSESTTPDGHFFVSINCRREKVRLWGDGPRSDPDALTPEVGIALRSPVFEEARLMDAIGRLLQASLRWREIPLSDIAPVLRDLAAAQATAHKQLTPVVA